MRALILHSPSRSSFSSEFASPDATFASENADLVRHDEPWHYYYHVHISLKYRYIFFETPKVASSSIKTALQRLELNDSTFFRPCGYVHAREYSPLLSPAQVASFRKLREDRTFFTFCFVRNPFTRLLSGYLDKIMRNRPQKSSVLTSLGKDGNSLSEHLTFNDFISALELQPHSSMNTHWRPQHSHLKIGALTYQFIGSFEELERDLKRIGSGFGVDITPFLAFQAPHRTYAETRIDEYYTDDLVKRVRSLYSSDFESFGYSERIEDALLPPKGGAT